MSIQVSQEPKSLFRYKNAIIYKSKNILNLCSNLQKKEISLRSNKIVIYPQIFIIHSATVAPIIKLKQQIIPIRISINDLLILYLI